jgi:hypothetical protein
VKLFGWQMAPMPLHPPWAAPHESQRSGVTKLAIVRAIATAPPSRRVRCCLKATTTTTILPASAQWKNSSFSGFSGIDVDGPGLDPWDQLSTELDRVIQRVETADQERIHAKSIVF